MRMTDSEYDRMREVYLGRAHLDDGRKYSPLVKKGWLEGDVDASWDFTALGRRYFIAEQRRRIYGRT